MNGAKYYIFELQQFRPDPNTADLKYALKSFHTACASVPGCDHVNIIGLPVMTAGVGSHVYPSRAWVILVPHI